MFDVFEILVPALSTIGAFDIRRRESMFGEVDEHVVYFGATKLGELRVANVVYSDIEFWTGSESRSDWKVLLLAPTANDAAKHDELWRPFLSAFVAFLSVHATWRVNCESDCDQHPLDFLEVSPDELANRINACRSREAWPIALRASPTAP